MIFQAGGQPVNVPIGDTLLDAAQKSDVHLNASCNSGGSCGKCKVIVESGDYLKTKNSPLLTDKEKEHGYVLACQTTLEGNA